MKNAIWKSKAVSAPITRRGVKVARLPHITLTWGQSGRRKTCKVANFRFSLLARHPRREFKTALHREKAVTGWCSLTLCGRCEKLILRSKLSRQLLLMRCWWIWHAFRARREVYYVVGATALNGCGCVYTFSASATRFIKPAGRRATRNHLRRWWLYFQTFCALHVGTLAPHCCS